MKYSSNVCVITTVKGNFSRVVFVVSIWKLLFFSITIDELTRNICKLFNGNQFNDSIVSFHFFLSFDDLGLLNFFLHRCSGHRELILGLNNFLPPQQRIDSHMIDDDGRCDYFTSHTPKPFKVPPVLLLEIRFEDDSLRDRLREQITNGTSLQRTFLRQQHLLCQFARRETEAAIVALRAGWLGEETRRRLCKRLPVIFELTNSIQNALTELINDGSLPK